MTRLTIYGLKAEPGATAKPVLEETREPDRIRRLLPEIGVSYSRHGVRNLAPGATQDAILAAYAAEIDLWRSEGGYATADVVALPRGVAGAETLRAKFLDEHIHAEDEVRFFVAGEGAFYLRTEDAVYRVLCGAGDRLSVPAGMRHWFDMGPDPEFTAIRLFTNPAGWVADFTGDGIARAIPEFDR